MTCNTCRQFPCSCGFPLTPQPFYAQAPSCQESHRQNVYLNQFAFGLQVQSSWNVPLCGESAVLQVPGVTVVPVGAYIWNSTYGYFLITAFDSVQGLVTVQNQCNSGNAAPGTTVPSCSTFVIAPVPCCDQSSGQTGVCVKYDFTAPANDTCVDITVTSEEGLIVGNNVQIGSGVYRLQAVKGNNVITICNDGSGITPGTPVIAQNAFGQYQYCLTIISISPCVQPTVTEGSVIVCASGSQAPLTGDISGAAKVIVLQDGTTGAAQYEGIDVALAPIICAILRNGCCGEVIMGDVPLTFISQAVTFTDGFYKFDFPTLKTLTLTDPCNYAILSQVTVGVLLDFLSGGTSPTPILGEVQLLWDNDIAPLTYSKFAWQDLFDDGWDISGVPPGDAASIQQLLPSPSPRFPMMYHAGQIETYTAQTGAGTRTLGGSVRLTLGENNTPSNVYSVYLMLSGWIKIFRV